MSALPPLQNDEPTLRDFLGRADLLQRVGDAVATCDPPHVFGVHGDWGAGKTSFLHQLQLYLTGQCPQQPDNAASEAEAAGMQVARYGSHVTVVWFEAWRYQNEQAPIVALLQEIRTQLPWYSKALSQTRKLGEVTIRSALLAFEDLTKKIGVQASKIDEVGAKWEQEHLAAVLPSHMVRQHLEHALQTLLGDAKPKTAGPRRRLVVMVDDLDRCSPEAAYKLIEGIKIYLNLPNCVFVLGMNQRIIEDAISGHIPKVEDPALQMLRAREYLDKLCQTIVHLPLTREPVALLRQYLGDAEAPAVEPVLAILAQYACLPANPRKIKAFANLLRGYAPRFKAELADPAKAEARARRIA
ncbi:MAG TPA: P-loop NTPase fold protein, partial [Thermoanaerobaculia bacterium]|nr:P-loop NTPase fold protein [Thermoanaerobaculia bacterium]